MTISQVATSRMCNFPSDNFPKVRLDPLRHRRLQWGQALRVGWVRGRAPRLDWQITDRCNMDRLGKLPLRKFHIREDILGKNSGKVASWEKSFGKVLNISLNINIINFYSQVLRQILNKTGLPVFALLLLLEVISRNSFRI